jgi:NAD(P)-dependent dehydrogenase (short-subunit alcohol dehydrogenase family)
MARVFITGSADGLGRLAAQTLLDEGHEVVVHARNSDRLTAIRDLVDRGAAAVVGDLSDLEETRGIARDVNRLGRMDAVIHNAGVYTGPQVTPVNIVAPYLLTALLDRPQRLVYLSSGAHRSGRANLDGIDWTGRAARSYSDSKLFVTTLAFAVARLWPDVFSNAVDPGWVPYQNGRTRCARRSAARTPHTGVARHQRGSRGAHIQRLLVPPAPNRAARRRPRPAVPRPTARRPGSIHRHAPRLTRRAFPGLRAPSTRDRRKWISAAQIMPTTGVSSPAGQLVSNSSDDLGGHRCDLPHGRSARSPSRSRGEST